MKTRIISAIVMIAIVLPCILISSVTRVLLFAVVGILCAYELSVNFEKLDARCTLWVMVVYLIGQAALTLMKTSLFFFTAWFVFCLYLALFSGVIHRKVDGKGALYTLAGLTYPCAFYSIFMVISTSDIWLETLVIGAVSAWVCDSFALFGGMLFGKHKIAPAVSPKKTVEGCVSGAVSSIFSGVLLFFIFKQLSSPLPMWVCVVTSLLASTMGQIGDLAESLLKRMIGVKDFSNLIPGHGGVFDRTDSLLFSIPTTYFCLQIAAMLA